MLGFKELTSFSISTCENQENKYLLDMFSYCDVVHKDNCFRITYAEYTDVGESSYAKICTICIVNVQSE